MSTLKIQASKLLLAADQFFKSAQLAVEYNKDPMALALSAAIGKKIEALATQYLHNRGISSVQININYNPPGASFEVYASGSESEAVQKEMTETLNSQFSGIVAKIISKYQKDKPLSSYKFATYEK